VTKLELELMVVALHHRVADLEAKLEWARNPQAVRREDFNILGIPPVYPTERVTCKSEHIA